MDLPVSIRHVLQSLLIRQSMALGGGWDAKYPRDWLVWEAGAGRASPMGTAVNTTAYPDQAPVARGFEADSLCFELPSGPGKVRIGRAVENDIVIPDATVSREHLALEAVDGKWMGTALPSSRATKFSLQTEPVTEDRPVLLTSGDQITLGSVRLTFLSAAALKQRVQAEARRLASS